MLGFDCKKNIVETRRKFNNKFPQYHDKLSLPVWMDRRDKLNQIYSDQDKLYINGNIFWASLVQANSEIFKRPLAWTYTRSKENPADIVFSPDPYFDGNPGELRNIAYQLFSYKDKLGAPEDIKKITDAITDEMERLFNVRLPDSITNGREVYFTTIMVIRKHLPKKRLIGSLFPVLANPEQLNISIILPKHYWTRDLCRHFCGK